MKMMNKSLFGLVLMTMTSVSFASLTYVNSTANTEVVASIDSSVIEDIKPGQSLVVSDLQLLKDLRNCASYSNCTINYAKADKTPITSITVGATLGLPPKVTVLDVGQPPQMYAITINGTDYTQMKGKVLPVDAEIDIKDK